MQRPAILIALALAPAFAHAQTENDLEMVVTKCFEVGDNTLAYINVDDCDPGGTVVAAILGRNGGIVEKAEAACHVGLSMMTRRPAQGVGVIRSAGTHPLAGGGKGAVRARLNAFPRTGPDGTGAIRLVIAGASNDGPWPAAHVAARMHVGDHFRCMIGKRTPFPPRTFQKIQIIRVVHSAHGREAERLTVRELVTRISGGAE